MVGGYQILDVGKLFGRIELIDAGGGLVRGLANNNDTALYDVISKNDKPILLTNINAVVKIAFADFLTVNIDNLFMVRLITKDLVNDPPAENIEIDSYSGNIKLSQSNYIIVVLQINENDKSISLSMEGNLQ